jgi:hypothetical protein
VAIALDDRAGDFVRADFVFQSVDTIGNATGGVWLDDVRVDVGCP